MPTEPIFSYAAAPHPVKPRNKFRSIGDEAGLTLMSDPRVRRGLTLKSTAQGAAARGEGASVSPQSPARSTGARHAAQADRHAGPSQPTYSFEVAGFSGSEFNLDQYLVASDELKNNNQNESCQTDEFVPLPPPAAYVPRKTGVDTYSQVEHQHELFDFNSEVKPVVDVIVKKTIEQALFELSSEEELKTLQSEINKFNIERETEARWIHLKEQETIEDNKFKERERSGRVRLLAEECAVRRRVAAAEAMRQLIPGLLDAAARDLLREKVWKDEGKELASAAVVPLIVASAGHAAELYAAAAGMVEELLLRAQDSHAKLGEVECIKRKRVHVHVTLSAKETGGDADSYLGCFILNPRSTISSLEKDIQSAIAEQKITVFSALQKPIIAAFSKFGAQLTVQLELLTLDVPNEINIKI